MIPILSKTALEYRQALFDLLGKGSDQALYLYQEWFREGTAFGKHPAFNNAQALLGQMLKLTSWDCIASKTAYTDGSTQKILFQIADNLEVETVIIPMEAGGTLCISSQVGCRMGCRFCETGRMGLLKNLSVSEIVGQVYAARHHLRAKFRNIVFMGMGEPFDNFENVIQAFRVLNDPNGLNFGGRHITISTSGKVEQIYRFADLAGSTPHLAVSLNAPNDQIRNQIMPHNRKDSMQKIKEALQYYISKTNKKVLIAYVLIQGLNDSQEHAEELSFFLRDLNVKLNLIPYNAQSDDRYLAPTSLGVENFKAWVSGKNFQVLVRKTQGDRIMAACGQLGNLELKRKISTPSLL